MLVYTLYVQFSTVRIKPVTYYWLKKWMKRLSTGQFFIYRTYFPTKSFNIFVLFFPSTVSICSPHDRIHCDTSTKTSDQIQLLVWLQYSMKTCIQTQLSNHHSKENCILHVLNSDLLAVFKKNFFYMYELRWFSIYIAIAIIEIYT